MSVRKYNVIYHLINDLKAEISDKMPLAELEEVLGRATVLQLFNVTVDKKKVPVAGTRVTQGTGFIPNIHFFREQKSVYIIHRVKLLV